MLNTKTFTVATVSRRVTREMTQAQTPKSPSTVEAKRVVQPYASLLQAGQGQPTLEGSGLRKRTKIMIALAAAVGFVAMAYTIDGRVEDNTPSSLGTRQDGL